LSIIFVLLEKQNKKGGRESKDMTPPLEVDPPPRESDGVG